MSKRLSAILSLLVLLMPLPAWAQVDRATLTGTVTDPSNAVIARAAVSVTSLATGVVQTAQTTAGGVYLVVNLVPGEYVVEATAPGFQSLAQTVALSTGQRAKLDLALAIGGVGESVRVEGVTPLLDTQSAVIGAVVSQQEVANLPLAIRNWDDLLFTIPGVQGDRYTEQTGTTNAGRTGGVSIHGNRSLQNNFLLDGVDNNSISTNVQELSTQVSRPSIDAIGEFKVVTSPFTAEYGRAPGGAIVVTTKSGTNQVRGTAYDYFRDERFDSRTYFAERSNLDKPSNDQNQVGANLGGPLARNHAFFFGDFETTRITQGVLRSGRVATEAERHGVFPSTIRDPLTGQPFPNNTIPASRIDPVARNIVNLVPLPNTTGTNNFIRQPNVEDDGERYLVRGDVKTGANDNVFVRYIYTDRTRFVPGFIGGLVDGTSTSAWGRNFLTSHSTVGGWTRVFSSSMVNELRVNVTDEEMLRAVHGVEVVNGTTRGGPQWGWPLWAAWLNRGARLTAVGGSDEHTPDEAQDYHIGQPTTVVWARELSEAGIVEGLKSGRVYIRTRGPDGPTLEFDAEVGGRRYPTLVGNPIYVAR